MKNFICFCIALTILVGSTAFSKDNVINESMILFSDSQNDVSKTYHSVDVIGFTVGSDKQTYSVVRIIEFPSNKIFYKLFITKGNKSKSIELSEIQDLEYLTLGKIGFDDKGKLTIPFLSGSVNRNLHLYKVYKGEMKYISKISTGKNITNVMYDNNILFLVNKRGQISLIENDETIKVIGKIKIESIKDVKRLGDTVYLIATRNEDGLSVNLIIFNINEHEKNSIINLEFNKQHLNSNFKIIHISKKNLLISRNPKMTPAMNPTSSIIQVDLKTKEVNYKYADAKAKRVVDINVACTEKVLVPMETYALDNGVTDNLIVRFNGKEILLNQNKNEMFFQIITEYIDSDFYILSVYQDIVGRKAYVELSLKQLKNNAICSDK